MNKSMSERTGLLTGTRVKNGIAKKRISPTAPLFKVGNRVNIYDTFLRGLIVFIAAEKNPSVFEHSQNKKANPNFSLSMKCSLRGAIRPETKSEYERINMSRDEDELNGNFSVDAPLKE